ncbi:hypothetical protein [Arthrobacter sp. B3I4]|uniref:hypothetical protein n=1 Tax=Arthrobacter sp. B3I4 TaxID=3042267 RepID=UPI0027855E89|nr:hypothetical protein [Arthrobacter sp. B3I4]MDQ0757313.1 hypothetical protein [Arthrobacter sp. B3I4]
MAQGSPVGTIDDIFVKIQENQKGVIDEALREQRGSVGRLLSLDHAMKAWEDLLTNEPEGTLIINGRREFGRAIYLACGGHYGAAFAGLRLYLELSFAAIFFSANELKRRKWLADSYDFSWSAALNEADGVLSSDFVGAFNQSAVVDAQSYKAKAAAVYRDCSQFIHGKESSTSTIPSQLVYSQNTLEQWCKLASDAIECVQVLFFSRYGQELLPSDSGSVENTMLETIAHLPSVRKILETPRTENGQ